MRNDVPHLGDLLMVGTQLGRVISVVENPNSLMALVTLEVPCAEGQQRDQRLRAQVQRFFPQGARRDISMKNTQD